METAHTKGEPQPPASFLSGGGEMGARMRAFDWSKTPLGPVETWPQSLRSSVSMLLPSKAQIVLFWGVELVALYNDAYREIFGSKHPWALARACRECWGDIWDALGPLLARVVDTGEAFWADDLAFFIQRHGYIEETYFDVSYDPVRDESGRVGGVFCIVNETTGRVLSERRLQTLRDLAARSADARDDDEACRLASETLTANPYDIPFALIYLLDETEERARLAGLSGIAADTPASPRQVTLSPSDEAPGGWPFTEVMTDGRSRVVADFSERFGSTAVQLPGGPWPQSPTHAVMLPLARPGQELLSSSPVGFLIVGVSPRLAIDDDYRGFFALVAGQVATAIANARVREEERKRAEALAELDRAKTAFFSNISHEFRTPLTLMLGPMEDLLAKPAGALPPEDREQLEVMHRNSLRLLKLVNSLLDFSRIEAGRIQAVYEPTDLSKFTAELSSVFRSAVERAGMRLVVDCPPLPEPIYVDREMWEKIVLNLLSNALKFTFEGSIEVRLRIANFGSLTEEQQISESGDANQSASRNLRCAILTVRDTGSGITEAELPHLFERFHRIRGAKARTHEGSGIGLALIRELARLHGGAVSVESEVGKGTTFSVSIPTGSAHLPADRVSIERTLSSTIPAAASYVEEALRWVPSDLKAEGQMSETGSPDRDHALTADFSARILLADDNADMRDYVERILGSHWTVEAVSDGRVALESALERVPDLVLTDIMMPGLDGFELLRKLRDDPRTREVPVILLSARAGEESRVEGLEAGADDYLTKPFSARELVACVGANLKMARIRRDAEAEHEQLLNAERVAREAASAASRAKDEFLATVSHELRSPLNAMLGWARLLSSGTLNDETAARGVRAIEQNAKAQAQLIEDLLDLSRITSGKFHLRNEPTEVVRVIETAIDSLRPTAEAKGVRLQVTLDPDAGPVLGDAQRLQQVVWNLLSNAVKFTPSGGSVQVRLRRRDVRLEIEVSDTGQGIAPEFLPYVFDRFRQADGSSTRKHGGLGLGLAIVRHITELHGGSVSADSRGKGQGATFTVSLPVMTSHKKEAHDGMLESGTDDDLALNLRACASLKEVRVLVVDDDPETLLLLSTVLGQFGAQVKTASSADEGFREVQGWRPNLIVSDIGMPGENGYQFMQRVRAWAREEAIWIPAVALTAYARTEDRMKALSSGYQIHLPKPVEPAELIAVIVSLRERAANPWNAVP